MKINRKFHILTLFAVVIMFFTFSCRKDFSFDEIDKLSTDSMHFEGVVAAPLVNTQLTLGNFFPDTDSSLWIEVDQNNLIHLRMYMSAGEYQVRDIFVNLPYPTPSGFPVVADSLDVRSSKLELKVYHNMFGGHLFFRDPKITLKFFNQIPIVTYFRLDTLTFHTGDGGVLSNTNHTNYTITAPTASGQTAKKDVVLDKSVIPILPSVFSPIPKYVSFAVTVGSKAMQNTPYGMTGNEKIRMDVDIDLPIDARLDNLVMGDTSDFKWETGTYSQIKSATLKIFFKNGFPLDGVSQIYFADTTNTGEIGFLIDSVFTDKSDPNITTKGWHLQPAQTDAIGKVTIPADSRLLIFLDHQRIQKLKDRHASKLIIKSTLNTYKPSSIPANQEFYIKMYSDYKLGVKIGIKAEYSVDTNDTIFN